MYIHVDGDDEMSWQNSPSYTMYAPDVSHWYMIYTRSIAAISIHGNTEVIDAAALGNESRR